MNATCLQRSGEMFCSAATKSYRLALRPGMSVPNGVTVQLTSSIPIVFSTWLATSGPMPADVPSGCM
ncbi:Uncharacterised protein [Mycobacterium tuberculosis]|nr:Uncharacterised protein [Mycobacterium tuberculosis]